MSKPTLHLVTGNPNKLREFEEILKRKLETVKIDLPELQGTPDEIALEKARLAYEQTGKPCIIEDTALCFNALDGMPGPYIKWFMKDLAKLPKMLDSFDDKSGSAICTICVAFSPTNRIIYKGVTHGRIVPPRGDGGFGWDPIFQPDDYDETFAEMDAQTKNAVSHRRKAIEAMKDI